MLAIEVEYLLGRAVAADWSRRDRPEWPPHPSRLHAALVDALADLESDAPERAAESEAALRWLEAQPAPALEVDLDEVSVRLAQVYWVPINDESVHRPRSAPLVEQRKRAERFFPAAIPANPRVRFLWAAEAGAHAAALSQLTRRVPYLGHSSSLTRVQVLAAGAELRPTLLPDPAGELRLRVPGSGRLDRLRAVHQLRQENALVQPPAGRVQGYRRYQPEAPHGPLGEGRVLALSGLSLGLEDMAPLLVQLRRALMARLQQLDPAAVLPEVLTGHEVERGTPSAQPHLALAPLGFVQAEHADGSVKGIALLLPQDLPASLRRWLDAALAAEGDGWALHLGQRGVARLRLHPPEAGGLRSLDLGRYRGLSRTWLSVTPVALSRHPKPKRGEDEAEVLCRDVERLGLPRPQSVELQDVGWVRGAPPARSFRRSGVRALEGRMLRHVRLSFAEPVAGPLLVGAGRYLGFGLLLPGVERGR